MPEEEDTQSQEYEEQNHRRIQPQPVVLFKAVKDYLEAQAATKSGSSKTSTSSPSISYRLSNCQTTQEIKAWLNRDLEEIRQKLNDQQESRQ